MASRVICDNGHPDHSGIRKAAREIASNGVLKPCPHCGGSRRYVVTQTYPYHKITVEYEVLKARALPPPHTHRQNRKDMTQSRC